MKTQRITALLAFGLCVLPQSATAQAQISAGVLVDPDPSVGSARGGPLLSVGLSTDALRIPLFIEAGVARTDFTSLGQDYHHNYVVMAVGAAWFPIRGRTSVGARLGVGAVGEFEVVETHPSQSGGENWIETLVPGLVVERRLGAGRHLVVTVSDYVLGPYFAVLDPGEYGVAHLITVTMGVRF